MISLNNDLFSHDTLSKLYRDSPEAFEEYSRRLVLDFIESAPTELREGLKQLQWVIDGLKYKYKDPLVRLIKINEMMFDKVKDLNVELAQLKQELEELK